MLTFDAAKTALVVIDLQEGILPFAGGPHTAQDVVSRSARLAQKMPRQRFAGGVGPCRLVC
ncbi:Isochorismatase family protein yecD [Leclercia adecarboxylata]|uniref:Isochorismatase family protein yecD n=1 Tax=Leclercia adecarboxylata TaxID=83655 RepID=A0A4U9I0R5_9ENTR|nr:Isochorismatase family protein yecD [Leclercia adecarboxylata]